jgi:hypothetical protein
MPVLFPLGTIVATPGALAALERAKQPVPRQNCHQALRTCHARRRCKISNSDMSILICSRARRHSVISALSICDRFSG